MGHADHSGVVPCLGGHDWALENIGQLPNMLADALQKAGRGPTPPPMAIRSTSVAATAFPKLGQVPRLHLRQCCPLRHHPMRRHRRQPGALNLQTRKFAEAACN